MPTYEYQCTGCSFRFELRRSFSDDSAVPCPKCHGVTRRVFASVPVVLKGSGFYSTDSQKRSWWQKPGMDECLSNAKLDLDKALGKD